jgi:hypothetical protein
LEDVSETVVAVFIPEGAHHLDLMFSHPDDPPSVREARLIEKQHIRKWVDEHRSSVSAAKGSSNALHSPDDIVTRPMLVS